MNYLILGGAGYLGTSLVDILLKTNNNVIVYDSLIQGSYGINKFKSSKLKFIQGDVENFDESLLKNIDIVLYLASPRLDVDNTPIDKNLFLSTLKRIYTQCINSGVKKFLFPSSCSVYGFNEDIVNESSPIKITSTYAELKYQSELILYPNETMKVFIPRISTLFGDSFLFREDLMINNMVSTSLKEDIIKIYGKDMWRPNLYVKDCAKLLLLLLEKNIDGIVNIGSNNLNIQKKDIVDNIIDLLDGDILVSYSSNNDSRSYKVNFDKLNNQIDFEYTSYNDVIKNIIFSLR
jgi:nucleoside-diphosphate-sugar epimerase